MADPKLPGLNYGTPLGIDDLQHLETVYTDQFIRRTLAVVGSYRAAGAAFGIVAEYSPINASASSDPLYVSQNQVDPMTVDVSSGLALAENGMLVIIDEATEQLAMVNQEVGQTNVVFVEYITIDDDGLIITKTRFNTSESKRQVYAPVTAEDPDDLRLLQVASLQDWTNDTLFPPDRRLGILPLAYANIVSSTNTLGKEVDLDLSRTNYPINRPWFSPVDIEHRSQLGTGASDVPHSLGLNDLSQGSLTLYDQLLNTGAVIGLDQDAPGVPGSLCFESVTATRVKLDTNGSVTGTLNQRYVELIRFPTRLLGAYSLGDTTNEILVDLLPHTNIIVMHQDEQMPDAGFRIQYATVEAGEPLVDSLINDEVHFRQPVSSQELLITGGKGFTELNPKFTDSFNNVRARISLGQAAAIPKHYKILADEDGQLLLTPQHVLCPTRLSDISDATFDFETEMVGNARIRIGLQNVDLSASTVVRLRLTGPDSTGSTVTEDLTFDITNYETPAIGQAVENAKNFQITNTVFTDLDSLTVLERTSDGPSTAVTVYAELDPLYTDELRKACPLADVMWDGAGVSRIRDIRQLLSRLMQPTRSPVIKIAGQSLLATLASQGTTELMEVLSEDFRDPYKLKLNDPTLIDKFSDGLRSVTLPDVIRASGVFDGEYQTAYFSTALRLVAGTGRSMHIAVLGQDAQSYIMNGIDGVVSDVYYQYAETTDPDAWSPWTPAPRLGSANGTNFRFTLTDDAFKLRVSVKGAAVGVVAVQYVQLPGSQIFSGIREYASGVPTGQLRVLALPFGQSFPNANYTININPYEGGAVSGSAPDAITVLKIEKFVDHAKAYIKGGSTGGPLTVHWTVDLNSRLSTTDEGFGDSVVA